MIDVLLERIFTPPAPGPIDFKIPDIGISGLKADALQAYNDLNLSITPNKSKKGMFKYSEHIIPLVQDAPSNLKDNKKDFDLAHFVADAM
jgi:hypothetical protein